MMKMKVDLKKKRALAAAVLLSMSCYGQAWADTVISENITIAEGKTETIGGVNEDVTICNKTNGMEIWVKKDATLDIVANNLKLTGIDEIYNKAHTIKTSDDSVVNINANNIIANDMTCGGGGTINIDAQKFSHKGFLYTTGRATININQNSNGIVQIEGNIMGEYFGNSILNINFYGEQSYLSGTAIYNLGTYMNFTFDKNAKWIVPAGRFSQVHDLELKNGSMLKFLHDASQSEYYVTLLCDKFQTNGGLVQINFNGSEGVDKSWVNDTNACNIKRNTDLIQAEKHIGNTNIILNNIGTDDLGAIGTVIARFDKEPGNFNVIKTEGALKWTKYELECKEVERTNSSDPWNIRKEKYFDWIITGFSQETAPTTSVTTLLSTITAGYDTWRNDTDKFNERMGELRLNGAGNEGVWVRTKGSEFGRHSSNGSYTNKQQTYQLGYDAVTSKDDKQTTYTGVAAEYGKGSLSFDSGTGTMKSMGLGVYQTKMYESGHYLDLVGRFDKYKNDFHVADTQGNAINGKYGNNALSMSAEYGRKNELKHGWYIEPQSEVTLGYMFGNDFTTSNNIRVEQKNMPALIGRLGLNIGREVSDKVNFYVKASINHDFLGNYDMQMTDLKSGERLGASDRFGSSWFDYGAGLSVKTGKDSYVYFDIERAVGGEYKKNWDWNAGVRWSF